MEQINPRCDKCNLPAVTGYELQYYGEKDMVTGYQDVELICNRCLDEVEADADDYADWVHDMQMDLREGF